jgi:thymidine kinase
MTHNQGRLEVICGSMFSGKTDELIRRLHRAELARQQIQVFKPRIDHRTSGTVGAHTGTHFPAFAVDDPQEILTFIDQKPDIIAIDEVQFFPTSIVTVINTLVNNHIRVIVAGLDLDFRFQPFGSMPILLALADQITKLKAVCTVCGKDANCTQRLINGRPAQPTDPLIVIGAHECYEARCRLCYQKERELGCRLMPLSKAQPPVLKAE